jgi:hypothetical protein
MPANNLHKPCTITPAVEGKAPTKRAPFSGRLETHTLGAQFIGGIKWVAVIAITRCEQHTRLPVMTAVMR